jgi:broad specificity phosphatase PhoE
MTTAAGGGGFDGLAGAGSGSGIGSRWPPGPVAPAGVRTVPPGSPGATRLVLIRHGEAVCNVAGVCGGPIGCTGLTEVGRAQVEALRARLSVTGELAGADVLYASVLPRAIETAKIVAPALSASGVAAGTEPADTEGARTVGAGVGGAGSAPGGHLEIVTECGLCELHPGDADGLTWTEFTEKFGTLDWDADPGQPIAPAGESWTGFVNRVDAVLDTLASRHCGQLVVVACHAGVIEASLLAKVPVAGGLEGARLQLRTRHASMTSWEVDDGRWRLLGFNDAAHQLLG